MKAFNVLILLGFGCGMLMAAPPVQSPDPGAPGQDLGEVKVEQPVKLEKALSPEDAWSRAHHGVLGQFLEAPSLFAPINPLAEADAGWGEENLSTDTLTGRAMGLQLLKFEF